MLLYLILIFIGEFVFWLLPDSIQSIYLLKNINNIFMFSFIINIYIYCFYYSFSQISKYDLMRPNLEQTWTV